jgi:hypothetical protein
MWQLVYTFFYIMIFDLLFLNEKLYDNLFFILLRLVNASLVLVFALKVSALKKD